MSSDSVAERLSGIPIPPAFHIPQRIDTYSKLGGIKNPIHCSFRSDSLPTKDEAVLLEALTISL